MKRFGMAGLALFAALLAGGTAQAYECSAGTKEAANCDQIVYEGCCKNGHVLFCETNPEDAADMALCSIDCKGNDYFCGWDTGAESGIVGYNCLSTETGADPAGTFPIDCNWNCTPSCGTKECGDDGCLGDCGTCPTEKPECSDDGVCMTCAPKCADKACGDDLCGGVCGTCAEGEVCTDAFECCKPACDGKVCGDDGCGGTCGAGCAEGTEYCDAAGQCKTCSCDGKVCGHDGCGKPCGTCTDGKACSEGACVVPPKECVESPTSGCSGCGCEACVCAADDFCCASDGQWDFYCIYSCMADCGGPDCSSFCVPDCTDKACGDDGCGGTCGACGENTYCSAGGIKCLACGCGERTCGDDGCGNSCGTCADGSSCFDGVCVEPGCGPTGKGGCDGCACEACVCGQDDYCCDVEWDDICAGMCGEAPCTGNCPACIPSCFGFECGDDGCEGSCGTCADPQVCDSYGFCCTPECTGKECGDNGCGGECGTCETGKICEENKCVVCTPKCEGLECGDDGCGGQCGTCAAGKSCNEGKCVGEYPEQCLGAYEPSAAACTAGLTYEGCCDASGRLVWCEQDGTLYCIDCANAEDPAYQTCGWMATDPDGNPANFYNCGSTGADPSGLNPLECKGGTCTGDCTGKECGDDGCGTSCGTCADGKTCNAGVCEVCTKSCDGKECGDDGCGGTCGTCTDGKSCKDGKCELTCTPACTDKECGDDGCGATCGTCAAGKTCEAGKCIDGTTVDTGTSTDVPATGDTSTTVDTGTTTTGGGGGGGCNAGFGTSALPFALLLSSLGMAVLRRRSR